MTTPPEPADDGPLPPSEGSPPSGPSSHPSEASSPANSAGAAASPQIPPAGDEGLPEWEPLTPELVEDEAIRGDFVIRWAIVGMALLLGFAPITDSRTLVHIRTGEYIAAHGFLPPSKDVFSYTATDRTWINPSWLFDLLTAGVHAVSGGIGLTILQGLLAGLAFGLLSHTYRAGIRTWWGSICAALALLACYPQFTVQPELMTLLGLAVLLWCVQQSEETKNSRWLWSCVGVVWLWSQFDIRAFLGWILLTCLAIGESLRRSDDALGRRALWWKVALASLLVTGVHPALWHSWASPVRLFVIDYPALQQAFPRPGYVELAFHPITHPSFWSMINHDSIAALVLLVATVISLIFNGERLHPGHVIAVIVFNLFSALATHELAAASLVNCVVCTINAQSWYRHRFGQIYSVDWRELLFSRGGRALTVFCFFAVAWMAISGRIDGPGGRRTGIGFHETLLVPMEAYQQIANDSLDDRPFHFAVRQGDFLIWASQKSFIDMRVGLFSGNGDDDLVALHNRTRVALQRSRTSQAGSGEPETWKKVFDKYKLTHVMPRLSGPVPGPDYVTFGDLMSASEWALTHLNASTAVFYLDEQTPPLGEFVARHRTDFSKQAFRTKETVADSSRVSAKGTTLSESLLSERQPRYPAGIQLASHYVQLAAAGGSVPPQTRAACAFMAIRQATAGLREDANSAEGYRSLGRAYLVLDRVETDQMSEAGLRWFSSARYFQTVAALQQAALLKPDDAKVHYDLLGLYERANRGELALESIRHIKRIRPVTANSSEEEREDRNQLVKVEFSLEDVLAQIETTAEQQLQNGADRYTVAARAHSAGAVRLAIKILEDEPIYKEQNPIAKSALGSWLIEVGRIQEGLDTLEQTAAQAPAWRDSLATSSLISGSYHRAIDLWREQVHETTGGSSEAALLSLPFLTLNPMWMGPDQYPFTQMAAASEIISSVRTESVGLTLQIGLAQLEQGDVEAATKSLQYIYDNAPKSQLRPLLKFYLEVLTDKKFDDVKPETPVTEEFTPLDEESPANAEPAAAKPDAGATKKETDGASPKKD